MDIATDASSIINLSKADALSLVAQLGHCHICVSPLVATECGLPCAAELKLLSDNHQITLLDADNIPADLYLNLLGTYELGEGETECIALCSVGPHLFCTDDQKARKVAAQLVGDHRVLGSLRLLRWC